MQWTYSLPDIDAIAEQFWKQAGDGKVIAFHGTMGSGKTTFIHALCKAKNIEDVVGSPTFAIINEYEYSCEGTPRLLFHMDLYRLNSEEEAKQAGVQDCLYSGNTCLVEWPDRAPALFPPGTLHVQLELINNDTRKLSIKDK